MKKSLSLLALATVVAATSAQAQMKQPTPMVGVDTVKMQECVTERRYVARVVPEESVAVVAQVAGEIVKVNFKEGDNVAAGALLYEIDPVKYDAANKAAAASAAQAKASLDYAQKSFDRTSKLFEKKIASADELDAATTALDNAKAALAAAEANRILAEDNLKHTKVVAPVAGRVGVNNFTLGNYVSLSSGALTSIVCEDPVRVRLSMSNHDFFELFGGTKTLLEDAVVKVFTADGKEYPADGKILFVDNTATAATDSRTIYVQFPNPDDALLPGSSLVVNVSRKTTVEMPTVPVIAVVRLNTGSIVYVVDENNVAHARPVETGSAKGIDIFVKSGLKAGEKVVTKGTHKVMDGAPVATHE